MTPRMLRGVSTSWLDQLACPCCETRLRQEHDLLLVCPQCRQSWPIVDGTPQFVEEFPYWGEIPLQQMQEVNRRAATSWKSALLSSQDPVVKRASEMILNLDRANWCLLTTLPENSRVLDLGAGMGTNSHALALRYREVVAVEPVSERVQFMKQRFEQEGLDVRVVRTSLWHLPFEKGSFDLIVMNGVLEWVAQGQPGDPRRLQEGALRTAARLLRRGGVLYVGIENRYAAGHFVGYRDPHCSLPWVTILPRPLAHLYAKRRGELEGYRNYLYSPKGYRKLLQQSGFSSVDCYLAIPSYNHPRYYIPLENRVFSYFTRNFAGAGRGIRSVARECALRLGLLKYLQYSFALVATK
jgi:SAM-dependent methyltransferase